MTFLSIYDKSKSCLYGKRQRLLREDEEITQADLADRINSILARKKGNGPSTVTQSYISMS